MLAVNSIVSATAYHTGIYDYEPSLVVEGILKEGVKDKINAIEERIEECSYYEKYFTDIEDKAIDFGWPNFPYVTTVYHKIMPIYDGTSINIEYDKDSLGLGGYKYIRLNHENARECSFIIRFPVIMDVVEKGVITTKHIRDSLLERHERLEDSIAKHRDTPRAMKIFAFAKFYNIPSIRKYFNDDISFKPIGDAIVFEEHVEKVILVLSFLIFVFGFRRNTHE